ncbi:MAG: xanthine dehydrogenase family protein molybdopterin-binding subunit, partial [Bradyrhizobium sp.]
MAMIGTSVRRVEDNRRLRGIARYVADIERPGMLHAAIFRSQHAHARLIKVDVARARAMPGVVAVITFEDIKTVKPIPMRLEPSEDLYRALQRPLANDRLRYVGEPIAVVVAETRYIAEDALEGIDIEVEDLEVHVDARSAIKSGAEPIHPGVARNIAHRFVVETGNVERALAGADALLEEEFYIQRHSAVPLETRGLVAEYDEGRKLLTVWGPTKVVHFNHGVLASLLEMPPSDIRMIEVEVGGGFGVRGEFYPEDYLIPFLARMLRRPVRWIEDRNEHLKAANHSREQWHRLRVGYSQDGRIVAFDDHLLNVMGAYIRTHGATLPTMTAAYMPGPYKLDNYRCDAHCVLVNKTPAGTYRGPGRFGASFVRERALDIIARKLRVDPAEIRLRNFIPSELMPYPTGTSAFDTPTVYDSGDYAKQLKQALEKFEYDKHKRWCSEQRRAGRAIGIGIGCFVEKTGGGPWEYARVEIDLSGQIIVYSGAADVGQGIETVLSQIVADTLPVDIEHIRVVHGDTAVVPFGVGSFGSRSTVVAGNAALRAAQDVKDQLLALAATALQADIGDLSFENNRIVVRGRIGSGISYAELATLTEPSSARALGVKPGISAEAIFHVDGMAFPYGVHLALVEVDQKTGFIKIPKYLIAFDVGRAVNPMLVKGQIVGGFAQGLGGALLEEFAYDSSGQLLSGSFMDYLLPSCAEVPEVEILLTEDAPSPLNPLGVKGAGEGGTVAVGATLANAICDAFDGLVNIRQLPLT